MPHPVVVIPAYYGSLLSDKLTGEVVWIDGWHAIHSGDLLDAIRLDTGDPDRISASGILDEFHVFRFWSPDVYKRLIRFLRDEVGYGEEEIYPFYLDWRKSLTLAADDLHRRILGFLARTGAEKVNLVAHSHGGLVARLYMHRHGAQSVENLITLGTPHKGMLDTFEAIVRGMAMFGWSKSHLRDVARSFPSAYELLPSDMGDTFFSWNGTGSTPFADTGWVPDPRMSVPLSEAFAVITQLPRTLPVRSTLIYGTRMQTRTACEASPAAVRFISSDDGDGTVPRPSAIGSELAGSIATVPVPFGAHSQLFNYPEAKRAIKDALLGRRSARPQFSVGFASGAMFRPYSMNRISVEVRDPDGMPIPGASVDLTLRGITKRQLAQSPAGDFHDAQLKMPAPGRHVEYEVVASAPSLPQPMLQRGILFAGNY